MSERTNHGSNVADQIQGEDAYGVTGKMTYADLYNMLDQMQTAFMDIDENDPIVKILSDWMGKLFELDPEIELP